jgi:hypothetical protein
LVIIYISFTFCNELEKQVYSNVLALTFNTLH